MESVAESTVKSATESAVEAEPATDESADTDAAEAALRIAGLKGPTTMGLVNLMADEVAENYNYTMYGAADEIVPLLVKGELDAAAVPPTWLRPCITRPTVQSKSPASTRWACSTSSRTARLSIRSRT